MTPNSMQAVYFILFSLDFHLIFKVFVNDLQTGYLKCTHFIIILRYVDQEQKQIRETRGLFDIY